MATEEHKFHYERFGFKFTVYTNRIEVQERQFLGNWKTETLLIKSITAIDVKLGGKLWISLTDGKKREYGLGTTADGARSTILTLV